MVLTYDFFDLRFKQGEETKMKEIILEILKDQPKCGADW
jgi:hypothetical protein